MEPVILFVLENSINKDSPSIDNQNKSQNI